MPTIPPFSIDPSELMILPRPPPAGLVVEVSVLTDASAELLFGRSVKDADCDVGGAGVDAGADACGGGACTGAAGIGARIGTGVFVLTACSCF